MSKSTRIDCFVVWNHGLPYISEIVSTLRDKFEIIAIFRKEVDDIAQFVQDVYACDSYPFSHLKSKTEYLLETGKEVVLVLVRNNNVDEKLVGKGKWQKPQCMYLQGVKVELRNRFNPEKDAHVIHGTDYEEQAPEILKLFTDKPLGYYTRKDKHFPFHLKPSEYKTTTVKIADLRCKIKGQVVRVEETPHYQYAKGDKKPYTEYFYSHYGVHLIEDHFPEKFDILLKTPHFKPIITKDTLILDGVHRAAIELSRGKETIKALVT